MIGRRQGLRSHRAGRRSSFALAIGILPLTLAGACAKSSDPATPAGGAASGSSTTVVVTTAPVSPPAGSVDGPVGGAGSATGGLPATGPGTGTKIVIDTFIFRPNPLQSVPAGTKVTVENRDDIEHSVTSGKRGSPDGKFDQTLDQNATTEVSFDKPGTYDYHCKFHPGMDATVVVT